ncbi:MAG: hypothetical protein QXY40_05810 [Candidatus Methanomethylicia archaeon]
MSCLDPVYQAIVDSNVKLLNSLKRIREARREVMAQLGLTDKELETASMFQWLLRLYIRKVGEVKAIKEVGKYR